MSLESTVKQWLTKDEQLEFLLEEKLWPNRKCVAITSARAILFNINILRRMRDVSDKQWRQLIDAHLSERWRRADLTISFFHYHDSLVYHDPHHEDNHPYKVDTWQLICLPRKEAKEAYRLLKDKEHTWKETRRKEHLEHDQVISARYLQVPKPEEPLKEIPPPYASHPPSTP